jgi:hypothetical protein
MLTKLCLDFVQPLPFLAAAAMSAMAKKAQRAKCAIIAGNEFV